MSMFGVFRTIDLLESQSAHRRSRKRSRDLTVDDFTEAIFGKKDEEYTPCEMSLDEFCDRLLAET